MKLTLTALAVAVALGAMVPGKADAMNVHVNGNQVVLSGDVEYSDLYVLADVIDRLRAQGRSVDTLVMRNSNGGAVYAGYDIGDFARRNQLTTVVSGYCISACSMMFVGGAQRAFAAADQPLWNQYIGIHGVTNGKGGYQDSSRKTPFYKYFVQAIADGDPTKTDLHLIDDAFSDHGSAYARLFDPAAKQDPSVFWCHPSCTVPAQYKAYPNDDVYNVGFINQHTPVVTNDVLTVTHDVSGNINPNYYNAHDPASKPYLNETIVNLLSAWNPLTSLLLPDEGPVLTPEAYLDDREVQLYNRLSPADRQRIIQDYVTAYFLQTETPAQLQHALANPKSNESQTFAAIAASRDPIVDRSALSVGDAYGIIKVAQGATWTLGQGLHTAADALILDGGNLTLKGGTINVTDNYFSRGGSLNGAGAVGAPTQWATVYVDNGARIHPTDDGLDVTGNIRLNAGGVLAVDVNPALGDGRAPLRFGLFDGGTYTSMSALSIRNASAALALNVAPGFYRPGAAYALVGYSDALVDELVDAKAKHQSPSDLNIVYGTFRHLLRADASGVPVAGYDVDPSKTDAAFHPFDGSLISYSLVQQPTGLWLQPNDPFTDTAFCSKAGCGLGVALGAAARSDASGLQPLLAALEFSNASQATRAAGQLRGDAYGSLRTASLSLIGEFGGALERHLRAVSPDDDRATSVALAAGAQGMGLNSARHAGDLGAAMNALAATDDATKTDDGKSTDTAVWGRVFGHRGRLDADDGIAGLRQHSAGVMFGVDKRMGDGLLVGGAVGYGKLRADGERNGFHGRVNALDVRFYTDYRYDNQYLVGGVGYTRLRQTVDRDIDLPLFASRPHGRSDGNAYTLHLEHGWSLAGSHGVVWEPILPSIDMTRLPGLHVTERDAGGAGLDVRGKHVTDTRVGVGAQVYRSFAWGDQGEWIPHARLLLQHRFSAHENALSASFQGFPDTAFAVESQRDGLNHAQVDLGISAHRTKAFALSIDYLGDFARGHRDQGLALAARYRW